MNEIIKMMIAEILKGKRTNLDLREFFKDRRGIGFSYELKKDDINLDNTLTDKQKKIKITNREKQLIADGIEKVHDNGFNMIRTWKITHPIYDDFDYTKYILEYIKQKKYDIKVQLGVPTGYGLHLKYAKLYIKSAVDYYVNYPDIVLGISLGNENLRYSDNPGLEPLVKLHSYVDYLIELNKEVPVTYTFRETIFEEYKDDESFLNFISKLDYLNFNIYGSYFANRDSDNEMSPFKLAYENNEKGKQIREWMNIYGLEKKALIMSESGWQSKVEGKPIFSPENMEIYHKMIQYYIYNNNVFDSMFYFNLTDESWKESTGDNFWGLYEQNLTEFNKLGSYKLPDQFNILSYFKNLLHGEWVLDVNPIINPMAPMSVGPNLDIQGDYFWWQATNSVVNDRHMFFDDSVKFSEDNSFTNIFGDQTWVEAWQSNERTFEGPGVPIYPHDGSIPATYSVNLRDNLLEIVLNGKGSYLGLPKVFNGDELKSPEQEVPVKRTYKVIYLDESRFSVMIDVGNHNSVLGDNVQWIFHFVRKPENQPDEQDTGGQGDDGQGDDGQGDDGQGDDGQGDDGQGDDQTNEPQYAQFTGTFGGTYHNGTETTSPTEFTFPTGAEVWSGFANDNTGMYPLSFPNGGTLHFQASVVPSAADATATATNIKFRLERLPFDPNDQTATEPSYDTAVRINPNDPNDLSELAVTIDSTELTDYSISIPSQGDNTFSSFLMYIVERDQTVRVENVYFSDEKNPLIGTWKLKDSLNSYAVGPSKDNLSWFSANPADRPTLWDDNIKFNSNGTFENIMGDATWVETWQGGSDSSGAPVAPHDGSNTAIWYSKSLNNDKSVTLNGLGAHVGAPKAINGSELTDPNNDPNNDPGTRTYEIVLNETKTNENDPDEISFYIEIGGGAYWRFIYQKV